ncbi:MAG: metallophosphoesterase [Nanoarchaeota archaeon]
MIKVLVFSDIHMTYNAFDYVSPRINQKIEERLKNVSPDIIAANGDIAEETIEFIAEKAGKYDIPVFFVGGNHDFYDPSKIPNVTDIHRKVVKLEVDGREITLAGIEGCIKYGKEDIHLRGYDDSNAGIVLEEKYYTKEKDYSWVVENFRNQDGRFIGKLPKGIDLLLCHCAPTGGLQYPPHESPPSLAQLLLERCPKTVIHGHLHKNYEFTFNPYKHPVKIISVFTFSPFDNIHTVGKIIELNEPSNKLNCEKAIN